MILSLSQIKEIACGAAYVCETENGFAFHRMTSQMEDAYKIFRDENYYKRTLTTAGVRLAFETDSSIFSFTYGHYTDYSIGMGWFDVLVNGKKVKFFPMDFGRRELRAEVLLDGKNNLVELCFPYQKSVCIKDVTLSDSAYLKPVKRSLSMFAFGDSITHGMSAQSPSCTYAVKLAELLGADIYNLAVCGDRFFPELLDFDMTVAPDIITVAYGTNDWYVHSRQTVERRSREFIKKLSEKYPNARIFAVSPIDRLSHERSARFGDYLPALHGIIASAAEGCANVTVIDGWELVPADPVYFSDGLHPTDHGMEFYAENLYKKIVKHLEGDKK